MRWVDGPDLEARIAQHGPLEVEETLTLLAGVADALDAAHARGLLHRDVKPANILLAPTAHSMHAYLADFGLARPAAAVSGFSDPGAIVGSVDYIAPEHVEGRPLDGKADIYGLACVLVTCLTGAPPFRRESVIATLWAHMQSPRPRLGATNPTLARLDAALMAGLAVDPTDRPSTARALIDEVGSAWRDGDVRSGSSGRNARSESERSPAIRPDSAVVMELARPAWPSRASRTRRSRSASTRSSC